MNSGTKCFMGKGFSYEALLWFLSIQVFKLLVNMTMLRLIFNMTLVLCDPNKRLITNQGLLLNLMDIPHELLVHLIPSVSQIKVVLYWVMVGLTMRLKRKWALILYYLHLLTPISRSRRKPCSIWTRIVRNFRFPSFIYFFFYWGIYSVAEGIELLSSYWCSFNRLLAHIPLELRKFQLRYYLSGRSIQTPKFRNVPTGRIAGLLFTRDLYVTSVWKSWHVETKDVLVRQTAIIHVWEGCCLDQEFLIIHGRLRLIR